MRHGSVRLGTAGPRTAGLRCALPDPAAPCRAARTCCAAEPSSTAPHRTRQVPGRREWGQPAAGCWVPVCRQGRECWLWAPRPQEGSGELDLVTGSGCCLHRQRLSPQVGWEVLGLSVESTESGVVGLGCWVSVWVHRKD